MAEEEQPKKKSNYFDRWLEKQAAEKKSETVADERPKKDVEEKKSDEKIDDVIVDGDFEVVQEEYEVSGRNDDDEEKTDKDASSDEEKKSEDIEKTEENSEESTSEDEKKEKSEDQPEEESKEESEEKPEEEKSDEEPKEDSHKGEDKKEETKSDKEEPKEEPDSEKPEEKIEPEEKTVQPAPTSATGSVIAKPGEYAAMEPTTAITSAGDGDEAVSSKIKVPKRALMSKREIERRDMIVKICVILGMLIFVGIVVTVVLWTFGHEENYSCELTTGTSDLSYAYTAELQFKGNKLAKFSLVGNMRSKNSYAKEDETNFRSDFRDKFTIVGGSPDQKSIMGEIINSRELKLSYTRDYVAESNDKSRKSKVKEVSKNTALDSLRANNFQCTEK